jgi:signal transduction histidine kinase
MAGPAKNRRVPWYRIMRLMPPARRAVLFLLALALPSAGVVALGLRSISQERELAERRAAEDRRREIRRLHDDLFAALERLKLDVVSGRAAASPPLVFALTMRSGRLVFPWEGLPHAAAGQGASPQAEFARVLTSAERAEYAEHRPDLAAAAYRRASVIAVDDGDAGYARLQLARLLAAQHRVPSAVAEYVKVFALPSTVADDERVPLAYYAGERLLDLHAEAPPIARRLAADADGGALTALGPAGLYKLRALLRRTAPGGAAAAPSSARVLARVEGRIAVIERALALARNFPASLDARLIPRGGERPEPLWLAYGTDPPWLVGAGLAPGRDPVVVVVDGESAFAPLRGERSAGAVLVGRAGFPSADAQLLGPRLPDTAVRLAAPADAAGQEWRTAQRFFLAALGLVLSVTCVGGYLLWRDVRREVRLADTRSQFVASVSHELKTPLTAIRMFAETLLMREEPGRDAPGFGPADRAEYLQTIVNESERLTRLLNNVLDFSRIDRGEKHYQLRPAPVADLVRAAARAIAYPASLKGIAVAVEVPDDPCVAPVDPDAIQQALLNLLTNALKYSGDAHKIAIALSRTDSDVAIRVRDWGIGIPASDHRRIFEKFYRVPGGENQSIPGTGLGLALVAHIAAGHGGRVEVESAPGSGSTFTILLPAEPRP